METKEPTCRSVLQMVQDGAREILKDSEEQEYLDTGLVLEWMNDSIIRWNIDALKD